MIIYSTVLGSCLGSFFAAYVYRYPRQISISYGHSKCPQCSKQLLWYDLIPIFSWLLLKGKCRYCGNKLSVHYLVFEVINAVIFATIHVFTNSLYLTLIYGCFISLVITLSWLDLLTQTIPISFIIALIPIVVMIATLGDVDKHLHSTIITTLIFGSCYLLFPKQLGLGDVLYMSIVSTLLYPYQLLISIILSCLLALIYLLWCSKKDSSLIKETLPFVPFLTVGVCITLLV